MKISVVVPAHNEEGSVRETLEGIAERLRAEGIPYELVAVDDDRLRERVDHALGEGGDGHRGVGDVTGDHELVAAEAGDDVAAADAGPQAFGDHTQQRVAHAVAERLVDDLEAVDVEQQ